MLQIPNNYVAILSVYPEDGVAIDSKFTDMSGTYKLECKEFDEDFGLDPNIGSSRVWKLTVAPRNGITGGGIVTITGTQKRGQVQLGPVVLPIEILAADAVPAVFEPMIGSGFIIVFDNMTKRPPQP